MANEAYSDGCNACRCLAFGGIGACTKKMCTDMCTYRNWDLVSFPPPQSYYRMLTHFVELKPHNSMQRLGYTYKGKVKAFDKKDSCNKECKCVHRKKKDLMVVKCPNERKCMFN